MAEFLHMVYEWFMGLGEKYGVNPIIFGSIYVGAIPFFSFSIAWLVNNYRKKKSVVLPAISTLFFFISSYLYLIIAGENVPWWVYIIILMLVGYGCYSTYNKIQSRLKEADPEDKAEQTENQA